MLLRNGTTVQDPRLDRLPTGHTRHLERYPLTTATMPEQPRPVVIGINWYSNFDRPVTIKVRGRSYAAIGQGDLGRIRGGHAVCLKPWGVTDPLAWWRYYDQGTEGRCVEFAWLRALSLMNRKRYDITSRWHYWEMQRRDYWGGGSYPGASPQYEGTSVDAGAQVMHTLGAIPARARGAAVGVDEAPGLVRVQEGIGTYRWAPDWDTVRQVTHTPDDMPGVVMLNSWSVDYPHYTILLDEAGERTHREDGEMCVVTDR